MVEIDPELALRSIHKAIEERGGNYYPDEKLIQYLARRSSYYTQADFVDSVSYAFKIIDLVNKNTPVLGESPRH